MSAYDHELTLASVAVGAAHRDYRNGYVYDLYNRGLGAPPLPPISSKLYEAGSGLRPMPEQFGSRFLRMLA